MCFMPFPGGADNLFELRIFWFPAEFIPCFVGSGDQFWWITRATRLFDYRDFPLADAFTRRDYFSHRVTIAVAKIVEALFAGDHRENVGLRQINNVDVIANAGSVGRGIVRAEDFAMGRLAERHLEHVWDQVRFDAMMFAKLLAGP